MSGHKKYLGDLIGDSLRVRTPSSKRYLVKYTRKKVLKGQGELKVLP